MRARGRADAELRTGIIGALCRWPFAAAAATLQLVTPNRMRGQVSAVYLLVVNLTGIGLGGTVTALLTDRVFGDDAAVGYSMALVGAVTAPLAALVLRAGLPHFRRRVTP
jgi:hypothetical protein